MERLLKHKKMVAVIAIIAAVLVSMAMILPSYAGVAEDMISAASSNGNAGLNGSGSDIFRRGGGGTSQNDYSSWSMSKTKAFEVPKEFSVRLHSYYDADNYAPTKLSASGNLTSKQVCMKDRSDRTLSMDPDDGPIFKLSDSKSGKGVNLTYHNLYIYDPKDDGALRKGKAGYVPVDLTVSATYFNEKHYSEAITDNPLIQFSKDVNGLPSLTTFNVGDVNIKYEYTYGDASSKSGQKYTIQSNMTYDDIDVGQGIGIRDSSASYYVAENSQLAYAHTSMTGGDFDFFLGNTTEDVSESDKDKEERIAFGQTYNTNVQTIKYTSSSATATAMTGAPLGKWTHFGASAYSMVKLIPPDPMKTVSDSDKVSASVQNGVVNWGTAEDENTETNGIGSPKTSWEYNVEQIIPGGISDQWRYDSIQFDDDVSKLVDIKKVSVKAGSTDATGWFDITTDGNHVTAKLKKNLGEANLAKIYRGKDTNITLNIRVALKRSLTMQDFRGANALVSDTRGEEGAIHIKNTASTTIVNRSTTGKAKDTINTETTNTYIKVPEIKDPTKKVSDSDEKQTDHNTIRFFDDEPFEYDVYQQVQSDQIHFDHFYLQDNMDPCVHEESSQGQIRVYDENDTDRTEWFNITVDENDVGENRGLKYSTVKATAKSDALKSEDFYGHTYDLRWKNDLKSETKYKDQGISKDWWSKCKVSYNDQTGHYDADKTKLTVPNQAFRVVDEGTHDYPEYIQNGQKGADIAKQYKKDTNKVDTTIHLPKNSITKNADRYEYQVYNKKDNTSGDDIIHYTVVIKNTNPQPDNKNAANYVVVKDIDFPDGLTIDPESYKVSGFNESNQKPVNSSEYGSLKHTSDEFGTFKTFSTGVNLSKNPDADTTNARYTIRSIKNKTGGGDGFEFKTRYMAYNEPITIEFDAMANKTLNGKHVKNTATLSSDGVDDKSDDEIVYINSPKMDVKKSVSEDRNLKEGETPVYKVGDTINYKVVVKNINPGTFARNMVFTDKITTNAGKTPGVKIDSNSIKVYDLKMHPYTQGSNAEGTSDTAADYTVDDLENNPNGFTIHFTKPNMGYFEDTTIPPVEKAQDGTESASKDAGINSHYNFEKDYKGLNLMKGYIVTYTASVTDDALAGKTIDNVAVSQPGKNTNDKEIKNDPDIPSGKGEDEKNVKLQGDAPKLKITKNSDKRVYNVGETGHYTVTVTNPEKGTTATHCIIKDQFDLTGMDIDKDSIKVSKNGTDITGQCGIDTVQTGVSADNSSNAKLHNGYIITPKGEDANLTNGDKYTVTYDVKFTSSGLVGKNLRNVARATSDNCTDVTTEDAKPVDVGSDLTAAKTSDPISGTIVKGGKAIKYTITVNNPTKEDKTNVMVRDMIPEHSKFVSSEDGKVLKIADKDYFTARIKTIEAEKSASVSFIVKVDENAADTDIIHNVAEVHKALSDELNHDNDFPNNIPDELFTTATFNPTNATDHPLRYWVQADNTVTIPGSDNPTTPDNTEPQIKKSVSEKSYTEGDTLHYTVKVNGKKDLVNPEIKDEIKDAKAKINKDSIKVELDASNGKTTDITKDCSITAADNSYNIKTRPSSGSFTLVKGDTIVVTYTAKAGKIDGNINNTASTRNDNNPSWISDDATVPPVDSTNPPEIKKTVKQSSYKSGDTLNYTVEVSAKRDLVNPVIKDQIKDQKAKIDQDSIKVEEVEGNTATDITGKVKISKADYSYEITTKPATGNYTLKHGTVIRVTYKATAQNVNGNIENTASTKDDNQPTWIDDTASVPPDKTEPQIKKSVSEKSYAEGDTLHYTVTVSAPRDLVNPEIKDEISDQKATINPSSLKVMHVRSNASYDITGSVSIKTTDYGYSIITKPSTGSFVLAKGDSIVVTYTAKAGAVNGNINNTASTRDDNNPSWISDDATVPPTDNVKPNDEPTGPSLKIEKSVEENSYKKGSKLHYTVALTAVNGTVKNVALDDAFDQNGVSYDQDSIIVLLDGKDITSACDISFDGKGMSIKTGKDLAKDRVLTVTYTAKVTKDISGDINNTATGSGDNVKKVKDDASVPPVDKTSGGSNNGSSNNGGGNGGNGGRSQISRANVQTGDNYNYIWIGIFLAAVALSIGYVIYRRRNRKF